MHLEAGIEIEVGDGKEIAAIGDVEVCFLFHFPVGCFFSLFVHVDKTSRQVERPLGRIFGTAYEQ